MWPMIIGLVMIGINITFSYIELKPFLAAVREERDNTRGSWQSITLVYRLIRHLPKLIPTIIDLTSMVIMTSIFNLGSGFAGGVAGLFASNLLSFFIYYHTHIKRKTICLQ